MQYNIEGITTHIQNLAAHVFDDYPHEIKNNQLVINTDKDLTVPFFSMVKAFTKQPVLVDFMTQSIVKLVIL